LQWIEHAAADSHGGALHYLAIFYLNGYAPLQIAPCETAEFVLRLEAAIQHDTTTGDSHFLRGSCYYAGDSGYPHDVRKALEDFLVASDLGHADAAVNAGAILHRGVTGLIAPDRQRAFALYQHAGEMGSLDGWRNVVACYATGDGVKQSMETAKYIAETMLREKGQ
jgi:TPR repeat protein